LKKKNKNMPNPNTGVSVQKKTTKIVRLGFLRRSWKQYTIMGVLLLLILKTESSKSPQRQAREIINRAIEVAEYIPQPADKVRILEALQRMEVRMLPNNDFLELPPGFGFSLVITPPEKMFGKIDSNGDAVLMQFNRDATIKIGHVLIHMNSEISKFSKDLDVKATVLIHELVHGLQSAWHLKNKHPITDSLLYVDERDAWSSQGYLFFKLRPELYRGVTCDCEKQHVFTKTEEQAKLFQKDDMIRSSILYYFCKDTFLRTLYKY